MEKTAMNIFAKIVSAYRDCLHEETGRESGETLDLMKAHFGDGRNWTKDMYANPTGAHCLVGAADHVRVSSLDNAKHFLRLAIAEVAPGAASIEDFNDTRSTYAEVAAVIDRAKEIAVQKARARPAPVVEILPPTAPRARRPAPAPVRVVNRRSLADWIME
jgi:hypothetical protein